MASSLVWAVRTLHLPWYVSDYFSSFFSIPSTPLIKNKTLSVGTKLERFGLLALSSISSQHWPWPWRHWPWRQGGSDSSPGCVPVSWGTTSRLVPTLQPPHCTPGGVLVTSCGISPPGLCSNCSHSFLVPHYHIWMDPRITTHLGKAPRWKTEATAHRGQKERDHNVGNKRNFQEKPENQKWIFLRMIRKGTALVNQKGGYKNGTKTQN